MGSNWKELPLEKICIGIFDCPHSTPKLSNAGPYLVRTQDIRKGYFDGQQAAHVTNEVFVERTKRVTPSHGDLLFSREGTYFGDAAEIPKGIDLCLGQRMVLIRPNPKLILPTYLRLYINSPSFQLKLLAYRDGTVAERLNLSVIRQLPIKFPTLDIQKEIIKRYICFEEKYFLNIQINQTLEQMVQTLFKSWFVDFDPVIDNALDAGNEIPDELAVHAEIRKNIRQTNDFKPLAKNIRQLFPNEFEESELGWIPKGWKIYELSEITTELRRGISPKYTETNGVKVINQKCIRNHELNFELCRLHNHTVKKIDGREIKIGDVLVNSTGVGTLGRVAQVEYIPENETIVVDSHVTVTRINTEICPLYTFGQLMLSCEKKIEALGEGSTGQTELSRKLLSEQKVLLPPNELLQIADKIFLAASNKKITNIQQILTLTKLRDTLLPKLISGELRLDEVEARMNAAEITKQTESIQSEAVAI